MGLLLSKEFADRLAKVAKWVESQMRKAKPRRKRLIRGRGAPGLLRYKLLGDLEYNSSANARLTHQDKDDGQWHDSASSNDNHTVYDALLKPGKQLPSGAYVTCEYNLESGLLNVTNCSECPEDIPA